METIKVLGVDYPVERFSELHIQVFDGLVVQNPITHEWGLAGLAKQSEAAEVILEVMVPTLPDSVISITRRGRYIFQIDTLQVIALMYQLLRVWRIRQLAIAKARKDRAAIEENQKQLAAIEKYFSEYGDELANALPESVPEDDLGEGDLEEGDPVNGEVLRLEQELARLKAQAEAGNEAIVEPQAEEEAGPALS